MSGPVTQITDAAALRAALDRLRREPLLAIDTEGASFHRYVDRVYLVQISSRTETVILDPVALLAADLRGLGTILADGVIEKVFHDADYDLRTLDRDYGFRATRLFDTRIAGQLLGEPAFGLAALVEKYLGVRLSKAHQRADWSQRPLTDAMVAYAADDTRHLPALRDALRTALEARGRLEWADEEFRRLEEVRWTGVTPGDAHAYQRVKGARHLTPPQLAALGELFTWREDAARALDRAVFRVIGNEALLGVARALPRSGGDLRRIKDLPASLARRHEGPLLAAVERALALPDSALPSIPRPPRGVRPDPAVEPRVERLKQARDRVARELGLDPGVLCGKGTLQQVARLNPRDRGALATTPDLRRWQVAVLGDALLGALRE